MNAQEEQGIWQDAASTQRAGIPGTPGSPAGQPEEGLHHLQQRSYVPRKQVMLPGDKINEDQLICK